jgi:FMN phosphatase YigB (HAD superfamily)
MLQIIVVVVQVSFPKEIELINVFNSLKNTLNINAIIMQKSVIFDFDGVILKNERILKHLKTLSTEYVSKSLNISTNKADKLQNKLLNKFGHTSRICHHIDNSLDKKQWLYDYNHYVFSESNLKKMKYMLSYDDVLHIHNIYQCKINNELKYVLFSNANESWINSIMNASGIQSDVMFDYIFCCDNNYLKPDVKSYEHVELYVPENKMFIDDNPINLIERKGWECYMHTPSLSDGQLYRLLI